MQGQRKLCLVLSGCISILLTSLTSEYKQGRFPWGYGVGGETSLVSPFSNLSSWHWSERLESESKVINRTCQRSFEIGFFFFCFIHLGKFSNQTMQKFANYANFYIFVILGVNIALGHILSNNGPFWLFSFFYACPTNWSARYRPPFIYFDHSPGWKKWF